MLIHGYQYNIKNSAVYGENGKEIQGISEVITPTIRDCPGGDTTVRSMPYRFRFSIVDETGKKGEQQ